MFTMKVTGLNQLLYKIRINNNKQLTLSLLVIMILMGLFWSGSRYPALNEKAAMEADLRLEDPLGFEAVFPVEPRFPLWKKVTYTNINWAHTNQQGMIFGSRFFNINSSISRTLL